MEKIRPFLWFNDNAEEAVTFYLSVFKDAKILAESRYMEGSPGVVGSIMTIEYELLGQKFVALNGGSHFKFNPSISFVIDCKTQEEVDYYWDKLMDGGESMACGWLSDKFGVSWQVTPTMLVPLLMDEDKEKAKRVMQAMMKMIKLDIPTLEAAAAEPA